MSDYLVQPPQAWLGATAWDLLARDHASAAAQAVDGDPLSMARAQNTAMLIKFFLEQACGARPVEALARRVVERDWGSMAAFEAHWRELAADGRVRWIVFGLGFFDFKFHLYALADDVPFCVSPVLCWCLRPDVRAAAGAAGFLDRLWERTDWSVGELRLQCLELPVDIFGEPQDCVAGTCEGAEESRTALLDRTIEAV